MTEVQVLDEKLEKPVAGVKVNNFLTDSHGITKFLDFSFNTFLTLERIGYQITKIKVNAQPIFRFIKVNLTEGDANYVKQQIQNWSNGIKNYRYELTTQKDGYAYEFVQLINGENKYTKTTSTENGKTTTNEIFIISGKVYVRINEGEIQEVTDNPEDFIANNLIIIPLTDVINEFFSYAYNSVTFQDPSTFLFKDDKSMSFLMVSLTLDGVPNELVLENKSDSSHETVSLKIDLNNVRVTLDEK